MGMWLQLGEVKKILVIDESPLFRDYLKQRLESLGLEVELAVNGLDGTIKTRNSLPDLVIMDYYLSRKSSLELLMEKAKNPNTATIPVIMASTKIEKAKLIEVARYNVKRFFSKPIKIAELMKTVSEVLKVQLSMDATPCIIEAHFNDDILFIEISRGLNREKIELLRYKIAELLDLYEVKAPKVLVMMASLDLTGEDRTKLGELLDLIVDSTGSRQKAIKILTNSDIVRDYVGEQADLAGIDVVSSLDQAMDGLIGLQVSDSQDGGKRIMQQDFLSATSSPRKDKEETVQLRYDGAAVGSETPSPGEGLKQSSERTIAIVDDDIVIQELIKTVFMDTGWKLKTYDNGKLFVDDAAVSSYDLVFLDLMMPRMNGFQVLEHLKGTSFATPIIILSALSQRETVVKAMSYGVKTYMTKPLRPESILKKTVEVLKTNF